MMDILSAIGGKIAELLVEPVAHQFSYVVNRKNFIENLRSEVETLEALRAGVQGSIDPAIRNREEIREDVKLWTKKVDGFIGRANKFLEGYPNVNDKCFNGWFPDLVTRYRIGKEAYKKTVEAKELREGSKFNVISNPAPPLGIESIPSAGHVTYKTTSSTMMTVIEALRDDKINFVGVHGLGGVGKTALIKEISKKVKSDKLFDKVVMAVVSQNPDHKQIQDQIAGMLGLKLNDRPSAIERASELRASLKHVDRVLVILDDVWAILNLAAVGIPFGHDHEGCKIIITTRREQVCHSMGTEFERTKIVHLEVLSEEESWDLFRRNVGGNIIDDVIAKEVCKACGGLPIALITVGRAMKGKNPDIWKEVADEFKRSVTTDIADGDAPIFKCLKLSYDFLSEEGKDCFLLCSLFPEDHDILIEDLVRYGMGLGIFKNVDTVQQARGRTKLVIDDLKTSCLLLASDKHGCIKMHDVVRDVAISIGSNINKYFVRAGCTLKDWPNVGSLKRYTGISLMKTGIGSCLPDDWECPNLRILLLQCNEIIWSCKDIFFLRMRELKVLDLSENSYGFGIGHLPSRIRWMFHSFSSLKCLQTLILDGIQIRNIDFIGDLKALEVLSLKKAFLYEAPNAIRELTNLRLLDMTESIHKFLIQAHVLSPLFHLEELYLGHATRSLREEIDLVVEVAALRSLRCLNVLTISIVNIAHIPEDFVFPELESFIICIGTTYWFGDDITPNFLVLEHLVGPMIRWRKCLKMLLRRASSLFVEHLQDMKDIFPNLSDVDSLNAVKFLSIDDCCQFKYLINKEELRISPQGQQQQPDLRVMLSNLETLRLLKLKTFRGICLGELTDNSGCFQKLRSLLVLECPELSTVVVPCNLLLRLQHLERLEVLRCGSLEQVFDFGSEFGGMQLLSKLRFFSLIDLPKLKHVFNCSSQCVHLCSNLRAIYVISCSKLKYVFQPSIAQALQQLEILHVSRCEELEEIVSKKNEGQEERVAKMVFKSLRKIKLMYLPNLSGFCTGKFSFECPSLEILVVKGCPKMKTFAATTSGIQSTPKLKAVKFNNSETTLQGMDLNMVVQKHFKAKETIEDESVPESDEISDNEEELS